MIKTNQRPKSARKATSLIFSYDLQIFGKSEQVKGEFMRTKEFIKKVKDLGFEYEKAEEVYFIYDNEGTEYAAVCHTTPNQISNTERAWDWIDKDVQEKLFDLLIEYAKTPIEMRGEEKYYLVKFSEKEIEEIKEKYDTKLEDFEIVEVEE